MYLSQIIHPGHFFTPQFCGFKHGLRFKVPQQKKPQNKNMQVSWRNVFHVKLKFHTNLYMCPHFLVKLKVHSDLGWNDPMLWWPETEISLKFVNF